MNEFERYLDIIVRPSLSLLEYCLSFVMIVGTINERERERERVTRPTLYVDDSKNPPLGFDFLGL